MNYDNEKITRTRKCNYCCGTGFSSINKTEFKKQKLLLVEGRDDERFFLAFFKERNINNIDVEIYEGKERLSNVLKSLHVRPGYSTLTSVGIVRDADNKIGQVVFEEIKAMLKKTSLEVTPSLSFAEFTNSQPRVGVFVLPGKDKTGELEDTLLESITSNGVMECVNDFVKCTKRTNPVKKPAKSRLYAWLSSQDPPDLRLGQAANKGLFDFNHDSFDELTNFINKLSSD